MKIAIVGAGNAGANIIKTVDKINDIEIVVVIDSDRNAEGFSVKTKDVFKCDYDLDNIEKYSFDIVIEVTGSDYVKNFINEKFKNTDVSIIDAKSALFLTMIVDEQNKVNSILDNKLGTIEKVTNKFDNEFTNILDSVMQIDNTSQALGDSVNTAYSFVEKSDELIESINKISNKNKILGLNANIEAARAGEAGRGFAVVANEVQKLSNTTNNFSNEIAETLSELKSELKGINDDVKNLRDISDKQGSISDKLNLIVKGLSV